MIESLYLKNFESHKNTVLEFSPGVNVISGESDHGKSSIIRGIYWIKDNKPSGASMVSFWNRDKKGNPKKQTFAEIVLGSGITVCRERSPELNGYLLGNVKLEAIGQGIPDEVTKAVGLSEVNVQYQFDRPFLLDESSAEVARFFNKTIRLDLIDKVQSKTEKFRKSVNQEIEAKEESIKQLTKIVDTFDWIEEAEKLNNSVEALDASIKENTFKTESINKLISSYKEYNDAYFKYKRINEYQFIIDEIESIISNIEENEYNKNHIQLLVDSYNEQESIINKMKEIENASSFIEKIDELSTIIDNEMDKLDSLNSLIEKYKEYDILIEESENETIELEQQLPDICPTCGAKL